MAQKALRIGDIVHGICRAHGATPRAFVGTFTTGSTVVTDSNGKGIVRVGDTGTTDCGHHIQATTGSSLVTADGIAIHRIGDTGIVIENPAGTYTATDDNDCTVFCD